MSNVYLRKSTISELVGLKESNDFTWDKLIACLYADHVYLSKLFQHEIVVRGLKHEDLTKLWDSYCSYIDYIINNYE